MPNTPTQSRLIDFAKNQPEVRGRWPQRSEEIYHQQVTPSRAVSVYRLRDGYGYALAWISGPDAGLHTFPDREYALGYADRVLSDLRAQGES